jgi:hypothetical protein
MEQAAEVEGGLTDNSIPIVMAGEGVRVIRPVLGADASPMGTLISLQFLEHPATIVDLYIPGLTRDNLKYLQPLRR